MQARWIGILVNPIDGGFHALAQDFRDGFVGGEHAFLDELVALRVDDGIGGAGAALVIEADFDFRHFEIERAVGETAAAHGGGEVPAFPDHRHELRIGAFRRGLAVEDGLGLFVGKLGAAVDHGVDETGSGDFPLGGDFQHRALCQAVHVRLERADAVAQFHRQHRQHAVHEVSRVAALDGFLVHRAAGLDVVGNVRDVDGERPAVAGFLQPDRVVVVLGVGGVDGDDELVPPIPAAGDFGGFGFFRHAAGFGEDVFGKRSAQAEAVDHADDVHARVAGPAEHLDDAAARVGVACRSRLPDRRRPFARAGRWFRRRCPRGHRRPCPRSRSSRNCPFSGKFRRACPSGGRGCAPPCRALRPACPARFRCGCGTGAWGWVSGWKRAPGHHPAPCRYRGEECGRGRAPRGRVRWRGSIRRSMSGRKTRGPWVEFQGADECVAGFGAQHEAGFFPLIDGSLAHQGLDGFSEFGRAARRELEDGGPAMTWSSAGWGCCACARESRLGYFLRAWQELAAASFAPQRQRREIKSCIPPAGAVGVYHVNAETSGALCRTGNLCLPRSCENSF